MKKNKIAIIGIGPRGLNALEKLVMELGRNGHLREIEILLFEERKTLGDGPVYDVNQQEANWINVSERALKIPGRQPLDTDQANVSYFPSFQDWRNVDYSKIPDSTPDTFPPRAKLGEYLRQRFQTLAQPLMDAGIVKLIKEKVVNITLDSDQNLIIKTTNENHEDINEVVLTIGHQPTVFSKEIKKWEEYSNNNTKVKLFKEPYPIDNFLDTNQIKPDKVIAIRGFGLAMIDVVRNLAEYFGTFKIENEQTRSCTYHTEAKLTDLIIPYSLNGLPPVPKVVNAEIDSWFQADEADLKDLEKTISDESVQASATDPQFLIDAIAPIAAKVYMRLPLRNNTITFSEKEIEKIVTTWLKKSDYEHSLILSQKLDPLTIMEKYILMCIGQEEISLDFCVGQVWRLCEHMIYDKLSFNKCNEEVFAQIIGLEERMKRYTYGPPLESIQQLVALSKAGVMNLHWANNPTIELTDDGWRFEKEGKYITANVMIDSVLDAPKVVVVDSPIVKSLLADELIEPVHDDLGVVTNKNGYVLSSDTNKVLPIALLGRLAKGTIMGVDSILQCFGDRPKQWAEEAARRHGELLDNKRP